MKKQLKVIIISLICLVVLLAIIFLLFKFGVFDKRSDCKRIADEMVSLFKNSKVIKNEKNMMMSILLLKNMK